MKQKQKTVNGSVRHCIRRAQIFKDSAARIFPYLTYKPGLFNKTKQIHFKI